MPLYHNKSCTYKVYGETLPQILCFMWCRETLGPQRPQKWQVSFSWNVVFIGYKSSASEQCGAKQI